MVLGLLKEKEADVAFFNSILRSYRACTKAYLYDYEKQDTVVLRQCATDLSAISYSVGPSIAAFWLSGLPLEKMPLTLPSKLTMGFIRLVVAAEVFLLGHSIGAYRQGSRCMKQLIALPTPLGGEIAAIVRSRNPSHWLLQYEQQPVHGGEIGDDGASHRPRIATEERRLAKIERDREQAASTAAVSGLNPVSVANTNTGHSNDGDSLQQDSMYASGTRSESPDILAALLGGAPPSPTSKNSVANDMSQDGFDSTPIMNTESELAAEKLKEKKKRRPVKKGRLTRRLLRDDAGDY